MLGKSFWHRFLIIFRCPPNLENLILAEAKTQFRHFRRGRCWHGFWLPKHYQNRAQNRPKRVPKGSHRLLEKSLKISAFRKGKQFEKSNFRQLRTPIFSQHGSQEGPRALQNLSKNCQKSALFWARSWEASGAKKFPKIVPKLSKIQVLMCFFWLLRQLIITCFHSSLKFNALPVHLLRQVLWWVVRGWGRERSDLKTVVAAGGCPPRG